MRLHVCEKTSIMTFTKKSFAFGRVLRNNMRIGSTKHQLQTIKINKFSLSSFDDKRFIPDDGHCMIRDVHVTQDIIDEPDWENDKVEEMPTSPTYDQLNGKHPVNRVTNLSRRTAKGTSCGGASRNFLLLAMISQ